MVELTSPSVRGDQAAAGDAINFSRSKVYEMIQDKKIPCIVVEGRIRVRRKDLLAWIDGNSRQH
jgi:excisionase family DNA binding protein